MIFNHDPPTCVDCSDCGGPSRCGMGCSALAANNIGVTLHRCEYNCTRIGEAIKYEVLWINLLSKIGYPICNTIGHSSSMIISLIDNKNPHMGVIVKMSNGGLKLNCSLSVSIICDSNGVQGPQTLEKVGICDYVTLLRHPSGCAKIVSVHGKGLGWFGTFMIIILCLFGGYLLAGTVYRFFLGVRGIDVIPNLDFWASLPQRAQSLFMSLVRKFRGPSESYRSSYSPVNF
ncbi:hypothetical protein F0562_026231 [Nyssa sinensis]|uniref:Uncharacterized protein n=1 Tax=Nyssa sinensis TaxID=561372 RepID=A0A5J5BA76_9ASTE|nr:hypothetical protein F0562_026231 [Nyssa sinensis]